METIIQTICSLLQIYFFGITKTYLYNFDPLKPQFYKVKLGFTGVHIIFLISGYILFFLFLLKTHRLRVEAVLTSTHNLCFELKYEKCQNFLSIFFFFFFSFCGGNFFPLYLNRHVSVMESFFSE